MNDDDSNDAYCGGGGFMADDRIVSNIVAVNKKPRISIKMRHTTLPTVSQFTEEKSNPRSGSILRILVPYLEKNRQAESILQRLVP